MILKKFLLASTMMALPCIPCVFFYQNNAIDMSPEWHAFWFLFSAIAMAVNIIGFMAALVCFFEKD